MDDGLSVQAAELTQVAGSLLHHGRPMRVVYTRTSWEGTLGSGHEITETRRECACGASLVVTLREPS